MRGHPCLTPLYSSNERVGASLTLKVTIASLNNNQTWLENFEQNQKVSITSKRNFHKILLNALAKSSLGNKVVALSFVPSR